MASLTITPTDTASLNITPTVQVDSTNSDVYDVILSTVVLTSFMATGTTYQLVASYPGVATNQVSPIALPAIGITGGSTVICKIPSTTAVQNLTINFVLQANTGSGFNNVLQNTVPYVIEVANADWPLTITYEASTLAPKLTAQTSAMIANGAVTIGSTSYTPTLNAAIPANSYSLVLPEETTIDNDVVPIVVPATALIDLIQGLYLVNLGNSPNPNLKLPRQTGVILGISTYVFTPPITWSRVTIDSYVLPPNTSVAINAASFTYLGTTYTIATVSNNVILTVQTSLTSQVQTLNSLFIKVV